MGVDACTARDRHEIASGKVPGQLEIQAADAERCAAGVVDHVNSGPPGQYTLDIQRVFTCQSQGR